MTREILWGRLRLAAADYETGRAGLLRDLAAATRDNALLVYLELGLDIALGGYLEELRAARGWEAVLVLDREGRLAAGAGRYAELATARLPGAAASTEAAAGGGDPPADRARPGAEPELALRGGHRPALLGSVALRASGDRELGRLVAAVGLEAWCESASAAARTPVFILLGDGSAILPSGLAAAGMPGPPSAPEEAGAESLEILSARVAGRRHLLGLAALAEPASPGARIGVAWTEEFLSESRRSGLLVVGLSALLATGAALAGGAYFARRAFRPLAALAGAAREIAGGVYGREVPSPGADEIGDLVRDFNRMSSRLLEEERTREEAEAAIQESLREKEVLLKEVHHRVKNNFQIINSLFELQLGDSGDPALEEALRDPKARIHAMALVHERLYQSRDFATLDFAAYIADLAGDLYFSYVADPSRVRLVLEAEPLELDVDRAIPCGLVLNELMTNALKYAFPDPGRGGRILVRLAASEEEVLLSVEDDGVGLPPHTAAGSGGGPGARRPSLGLSLARSLAQQLRGRLELSSGPGLRASLAFPRRALSGHTGA